jgi:phosphate transport system permease protein
MHLLKRGIPFWLIIVIQILSFLYIFLTLSGNTTLLVFIFPFIVGEILIFTPIIFKKKKKYFYIGWEMLIFFFALILIVFNFDFTFQVYNPDIITISFFASMLLLIEGLVLSYMIFRERAVKKILFVLASSTTVIVFLIVFFVMSEGIYAFNENDPIEFITGDYWRPGYEIESSESILVTTTVESYNFSVILNDENIYISPNSNRFIKILLENNGACDDTYFLNSNFDKEINVSTNTNEITIQSHKQKEIILLINSTSEIGNYEINFIATSKSTNQKREVKINCKVSERGIDLTPDIQSIKAYQSGVNLMFRVPLELTNIGIFNDTYKLTIDSPSYFSPSLNSIDEEWNYSTSSMNVDLLTGESKNITLIPRMISRIVGTHLISITATSENDSNIHESADLYFIYSIKNYIKTNISTKTIAPTGSVNYSFILQGIKGETLDIKIENVEDNFNTLVKNETGIVLSNEGRETITLDENGTASIQLQVFSMDAKENDVSVIKMTVFKPGYSPSYGILPFIVGTFLTTLIALIIAIPLALGCAIFLAEYCPKKIRNILRPIYELLAGIPSVLFGLWGFLAFGPWLAENVYLLLTNTLGQFLWFFSDNIKIGNDILTASIVLSIMILPIIITLSEDSIRSVPRSFKEGSLAMGATKWQTIRRVLIPASKSGIVSSIILAMGRAIGETMAVLMIMQYSPDMPKSLFDAVGTMTSVIATQLGDSFSDDLTRHALFAIGMILFFIIFGLNIIIFLIQREKKNKSKSGFLSKINFFRKISSFIVLTGLIGSEKIQKKRRV